MSKGRVLFRGVSGQTRSGRGVGSVLKMWQNKIVHCTMQYTMRQ